MSLPSVLLGICLAAILGCAFHFWRGGGFKWMIFYILFAIIGFWAGHFIGSLVNLTFWKLGPINLGMSIVGSLVFLFGGYWLSMASVETKRKK